MIERKSNQLIVVTLNDDPAFSQSLAEARTATPVSNVVLDFAKVNYVNSANLSHLLSLRNHLHAHDRRMRLAAVNPQVWKLFTVTGLHQVFDAAKTVDEAIASL